jgi:hypothetical protein
VHVRCAVDILPSLQRDDTVTAYAGLDVQRDTSPPTTPLAFFTFLMLLAPVTNWELHGVTLVGYCYVMRQWDKSSDSNFVSCQSQRYGVAVRSNVTSAYPP